MPSLASRLLQIALRIRKLKVSRESLPPNYRKLKAKHYFSSQQVQKRFQNRVQAETLDGYTVYTYRPKNPTQRTIVWLHGGAYVLGPFQQHFDQWIKLCDDTQSMGVFPEYPKAPEFNQTHTKKFLDQVYAKYLSDDVPFFIVGDSAGGGLGLSFALELQKSSRKLPKALMLFSPWLDLSFSQAEVSKYELTDHLIHLPRIRYFAEWYSQGTDLKNEWVSPLSSDVKKITFPVTIYSSDNEVLHLAVLEFQKKYPEVYVRTFTQMPHAWPLMPIPEARQVMDEVANSILTRNR